MVNHLPTNVNKNNNDGQEETVAGKGLSHYTNVIFQPLL